MFCRKCGNQLPDNAQFCTRCGYSTNDNFNNNNAQNIPDKEKKFNEKLKGAKWFSILVSCVFGLVLALSLEQKNYLLAILSLVFIVSFTLFYNLSKKKLIAGPIIGIVLGSLYIVSFIRKINIISLALGIVVIWDSTSMLKYLKDNIN